MTNVFWVSVRPTWLCVSGITQDDCDLTKYMQQIFANGMSRNQWSKRLH